MSPETALPLQPPSAYEANRDIVFMTLPLLALSTYFYGARPAVLCLTAAFTAMLCDHLVAWLRHRPCDKTENSSIPSALVLVLLLLSPVAYVETACRPQGEAAPYTSLLPPADHRPESRMLMTYPEWHIVHAYDDYARVIRDGDPHDYGFLRGIGGFWSSLCALSQASGAHGGVDGGTKQMVYVIGTSFTLELALKAAYEETLGRVGMNENA